MPVISNTTPLINFAVINRFDIFQALFKEIMKIALTFTIFEMSAFHICKKKFFAYTNIYNF